MVVRRIVKACCVAQRLAIDNFHSLEVTSACVVFISLLGQDTSILRLHLQVASQLAGHLSNQTAATSSIHQSPTGRCGLDPLVMTEVCKCVVLTLGVRQSKYVTASYR